MNRKRYLQGKVIRDDISDDDYEEYKMLKQKLETYGFYEEVEDQWFKYYIAEMSKHEIVKEIDYTDAQKKELQEISAQIVKEIVTKKKNNESLS